MKRRIISQILILVLTMTPLMTARTESYDLDLAVPFGVAHIEGKSSVPLYSNAQATTIVASMPDYQICQILDTLPFGNEVWFKIQFIDQDEKTISGFTKGTDFFQLTLAGLVKVMTNADNAAYIERFAKMQPSFIGSPTAKQSSSTRSRVATQASGASILEEEESYSFILNIKTKKFHLPSCSSVNDIAEGNRREYSGTSDDLIKQGYSPCKKCIH